MGNDDNLHFNKDFHIFDEIDGKYIFLYNEVEDKYYVKILGQNKEIELKVIVDKKRDRYFIRFIFPKNLINRKLSSYSKNINLIKEKICIETKKSQKGNDDENILIFDNIDDIFYFKYNIKEDKYFVTYKELDRIIELKVRYNKKRDFHQISYYISKTKTYTKTINQIKNKIYGVYEIGENSKIVTDELNDKSIYVFDEIDNRFLFIYKKDENVYFVIDKKFNIKTKLDVKYSENRDIEYIRFYYPKPNNIINKYYHKSVYVIQFQLFGNFEKGSGSQLTLNDNVCKNIIQKSYEDLGFLLGYTEMIQSKDSLIRKVYSYISNNGGVSKYIQWVNELGINTKLYFKDHNDVFLKSSFEFIFFSILHHNGIIYEYEPFKINSYVPDFYIPKKKVLVEILGLNQRENYFIRTKDKEKLYKSKGFNYNPIIVDRHHPKESIFNGCVEIFGDLNLPNYNDYYRRYILKSDEFIIILKKYLSEVNNGELKVGGNSDKISFSRSYPKYYKYVIDNYGNVQIAIKELIGIPSTKFKSQKIENYWMNKGYVKDELENVFKNEKRIPSKNECYKKFRNKYNIWNVYRFWGEESILEGGVFFDFINELKLKYGIRDLIKENQLKKENDISKKVQLVIDGKIPTKGRNSFRNKYRWMNEFLQKEYGGLFFYIKSKIGYPPPHILRPNGYYQIEGNVKYELEENWKIYKRIPTYSERLGSEGKENTFNNMIGILGVNSFNKGGKYFKFIETLKVKYGYDDSIEKSKIEYDHKVLLYLNGINDGKWNTKTKSSKELGIHKGYFSYVYKKYGNIFLGIKEIIGFPNPNVIRYHKYYDDIDNCKYEIEQNILRLGYLPKRNDLRKPPLKGNCSLLGVYEKWGVGEFEKGGKFYTTIQKSLRNLEKVE